MRPETTRRARPLTMRRPGPYATGRSRPRHTLAGTPGSGGRSGLSRRSGPVSVFWLGFWFFASRLVGLAE